MGVNNFNKNLAKVIKYLNIDPNEYTKQITYEDLVNKTIVVDADGYVVRKGNSSYWKNGFNSQLYDIEHVAFDIITVLLRKFDQYNITPIFIFDGKGNELKITTQEYRKIQIEKANQRNKEKVKNMDVVDYSVCDHYHFTQERKEYVFEQLNASNIKYIQVHEHDADSMVAYMLTKDNIDGAYVYDTDYYFYNIGSGYKLLFEDKNKFKGVDTDKLWSLLNITDIKERALIAVMSGNDMFPGIALHTPLNYFKNIKPKFKTDYTEIINDISNKKINKLKTPSWSHLNNNKSLIENIFNSALNIYIEEMYIVGKKFDI